MNLYKLSKLVGRLHPLIQDAVQKNPQLFRKKESKNSCRVLRKVILYLLSGNISRKGEAFLTFAKHRLIIKAINDYVC